MSVPLPFSIAAGGGGGGGGDTVPLPIPIEPGEPGLSDNTDLTSWSGDLGNYTDAGTTSGPNNVDVDPWFIELADPNATIAPESVIGDTSEFQDLGDGLYGFVVNLTVGDNVVSFTVTAEDGVTTRQYTHTINRAAAAAPPEFTVAPAITSNGDLGSPLTGDTLTCDGGTVTGDPTPTKTYQWERNNGGPWEDVSGATTNTYNIGGSVSDSGYSHRCKVHAENSEGFDDEVSNASGPASDP